MISASTEWSTGRVQLEWHSGTTTDLPVTGSHGFVFGDSGILLARVNSRGLSIPGGHLDAGESPEQCLIREFAEEVRVEIRSLILLGYIVCDHSANPEYRGPYEVRAAQAVFYGKVNRYLNFQQTPEVSERLEVPATDLPKLHHEWNSVLDAAFVAASNVANES